jgi:GNAT superfamily N-acetyltransferase
MAPKIDILGGLIMARELKRSIASHRREMPEFASALISIPTENPPGRAAKECARAPNGGLTMAVKPAPPKSIPTLQFTSRLSCQQVEQLWHMYQAEWWSCGREIEDVRRAVQHSDLIFAFRNSETGRLAAFARVLTDYVYKAVIFDVIVDRPYRATGVGRLLLEAITSHPALLFVEHMELYCRPEMVSFYRKWGFTADLDELCFMRKKQKPFIRVSQVMLRQSSQDFKTSRTEVLVERESLLDIQTAHHRETRAIDRVGARSGVAVK